MERNYADRVSNSVKLFVGTEVEHTPAYGMKTLFVVDIQNPTEIIEFARKNNCEHIYFGANQSFPIGININDIIWNDWQLMIIAALQEDFLCTLDIDVRCVEGLLECSLCEFDNFIPMISVKIPYTKLLNYNTTIKIDDKDFKASNPGVWCIPLTELTKRSYFTDWRQYNNDEIIK